MKTLLTGAAALLLVCSGIAAPSGEPPSAQVVFLCVNPPIPSRYKLEKDGLYHTVVEDERLSPPTAIYYKDGSKYTPITLNNNAPTAISKISGEKRVPSEFFIPDPTPAPEGQKDLKRWAPFVSIGEVAPGSSRLVCLFKKHGSAFWQPPGSAVVDMAPDKVPDGSVIVINLSSHRSYVQVGAASKPAVVEAGGSMVCTNVRDAEGLVIVKAAAVIANTTQIVSNTGKILPPDRRAAFVIYDANKAYAKKDCDILFLQFGATTTAAPAERK